MLGIVLDVDWAPDFVIDDVARRLIETQTPASWFVTHSSPAINRLRDRPDLFEIGVHPNFLPGSTHGRSVDEVLNTMMEMAPEAVSMRTHGLVQSTAILERVLALTPFQIDASLFLAHAPHLRPFDYWWNKKRIIRVPTFWEDDLEWQRPAPEFEVEKLLARPGVKVFAFHPIHIFLNSKDQTAYQAMKLEVRDLTDLDKATAEGFVQPGRGVSSFFMDLIARAESKGPVLRVKDIARAWENGDFCGRPAGDC